MSTDPRNHNHEEVSFLGEVNILIYANYHKVNENPLAQTLLGENKNRLSDLYYV